MSENERGKMIEEKSGEYDLKVQFEKLGDCDDENYYSTDCNKFLLKNEK